MTIETQGTPESWQTPLSPDWSCSGTTPDGLVSHVTNIYVTGAIPSEYRTSVLNRIFCLYVINELSDASVMEASECLADIFRWQIENEHVIPGSMQYQHISTSVPERLGRIW